MDTENEEKITPKAENNTVDKEINRLQDELSSHKNLTKDELAKIRRELVDLLESKSQADAKERGELKEMLSEVKEYINKLEEKKSHEHKAKSSKQTMILPPNDTKIEEHVDMEIEEKDNEPSKKRGLVKRILW